MEGMTTAKEKIEEEKTADMMVCFTAWAKRKGTKVEVKGGTDPIIPL